MTSAFSLVTEDVEKFTPTGIHDALRQVMIFDHIGDLKVLYRNMVIVIGVLLSRLKVEITALTANLEMGLSDVPSGFPLAMRTLLPSAQRSLLASQGSLTLAIIPGVSNRMPLAISQEAFQANVNPDMRMLSRC